jgi:hypothetical protein
MGYDKGHKEFHGVDMTQGFQKVPGYPWGFTEKILAGSLDEKNKVGNRTRILKIEPGAFSTVPFVHEYWEEVFLVSGDLVCGSDDKGQGGESFTGPTYCVRPPGVYHGPFTSKTGCLLARARPSPPPPALIFPSPVIPRRSPVLRGRRAPACRAARRCARRARRSACLQQSSSRSLRPAG